MLIVDSWLSIDGHIPGRDLHVERFTAACPPQFRAGIPTKLRDLWEETQRGEWFPRIECDIELGLRTLARRAPQRRRTTSLYLGQPCDPRSQPTLKGPDLEVLASMRKRAQAAGADDALLHRNGFVVEAAHATVVFWDGKTLVRPAGERLPSVTEAVVVGALRKRGFATVSRSVTIEEAVTLPGWVLSSLHGVTTLDSWVVDDTIAAGKGVEGLASSVADEPSACPVADEAPHTATTGATPAVFAAPEAPVAADEAQKWWWGT